MQFVAIPTVSGVALESIENAAELLSTPKQSILLGKENVGELWIPTMQNECRIVEQRARMLNARVDVSSNSWHQMNYDRKCQHQGQRNGTNHNELD
jgi:hypothetical protein